MQENIIKRISSDEAKVLHLAIARILRRETLSGVAIESANLIIASHFDKALELLEDIGEKEYVIFLNYQAAVHSISMKNEKNALVYLQDAINVMRTMEAKDIWKISCIFEIFMIFMNILQKESRIDEAENILNLAKECISQSRYYTWTYCWVKLRWIQKDIQGSLELGLNALYTLGFIIPKSEQDIVLEGHSDLVTIQAILKERLPRNMLFASNPIILKEGVIDIFNFVSEILNFTGDLQLSRLINIKVI